MTSYFKIQQQINTFKKIQTLAEVAASTQAKVRAQTIRISHESQNIHSI